jgi:sugar/nucleoside kinase (ribokinase family)
MVADDRPMQTDPPPIELDLLIVGGLTVDWFEDGSRAPGGSVLHAIRAVAGGDRRLGVVTLAGDEPEAIAARRELRDLSAALHVQSATGSICFEHHETASGRALTFVRSAGRLACPPLSVRPAAVLYAPVADELDAGLGGQAYPGARRGAILQGWLRHLRPGHPVGALPLGSLPAGLLQTLAGMDLVVASREDLAAHAAEPFDLLAALRAALGTGPAVVVTDGAAGMWLDLAGPGGVARWHMPAPRVVEGVSTVGAGDALAAAMLFGPWPDSPTRDFLADRGRTAMDLVLKMLEARRRRVS